MFPIRLHITRQGALAVVVERAVRFHRFAEGSGCGCRGGGRDEYGGDRGGERGDGRAPHGEERGIVVCLAAVEEE